MSTKKTTIDFLIEQLRSATGITSRKMFGEYALYCDGKVVALVCDDQLYVKPTHAGKTYIETPEEAPPYPGAKLYYRIDGDRWEDGEWLSKLIRITANELPVPKRKK